MSKENQLLLQGGVIIAILGAFVFFSPAILSIIATEDIKKVLQAGAIKFLSGLVGGILVFIGVVMAIVAKIKQGVEKFNDQ